MIIPPYLNPGDTIGIISPASKVEEEKIIPALELIEQAGFQVIIGSHTFNSYNQFSANDLQRAGDLQKMLDNKEIKAILCTRGGYGSLRVLPYIRWNLFIKNPKWIIGYSDITVLHSQLNHLRIASVHGPMPNHFLKNGKPSQSLIKLIDALTQTKLSYTIKSETYYFKTPLTGEIVGGNLSMLYSIRGTPFDLDTEGKILFIEDLGEYLYHLDRMMQNLKFGKKLEGLKALIVGDFTEMKDQATPFGKEVKEIILDAVTDYSFPVVFNFPGGHSDKNYPIKLGVEASLTPSSNGYIFEQK